MTYYHTLLSQWIARHQKHYPFFILQPLMLIIWIALFPLYLRATSASFKRCASSPYVALFSGYLRIGQSIIAMLYPEHYVVPRVRQIKAQGRQIDFGDMGLVTVNLLHDSKLIYNIALVLAACSSQRPQCRVYLIRRHRFFADVEQRWIMLAKQNFDVDLEIFYVSKSIPPSTIKKMTSRNAVVINMIDTPAEFGAKVKRLYIGTSSFDCFVGATLAMNSRAEKSICITGRIPTIRLVDVWEESFWVELSKEISQSLTDWALLEYLQALEPEAVQTPSKLISASELQQLCVMHLRTIFARMTRRSGDTTNLDAR